MLFLAATQMVIIVPLHEYARFLFFCDLFWFPFFTLAVLIFRYMFKTLGWESFSSKQFLEYSLVFSLMSGLTIAIFMWIIFSSFYWHEITTELTPNNSKRALAKFVMGSILGNWIQTTIFISAWIFLYNSITSTKIMRETELRYLRAQHNLKEATLNSLSNQLNPHFLFNALNNIRFMIHENQKSADSMITSLSEILRYSLESSRREKVTLAEEINIIHRYIEIVKSQLEERLNFQLLIAEDLYDYLIPPMVLQMLIENGIKHGLENIKQGGELSVSCEDLHSRLRFHIVNDLANTAVVRTPTTGIGLKNIRRRLELLYGNEGELLVSKTAEKFTVTLSIPKELS
ncbi:histidine kinase [Cellvibrio zantedeschiae]|uniref:Histidine kinase n=1 Tax=Cellvibrio zantedeschiae TaxID=1237077 RepID=A0ABQ3AXU1_9GAMM|nr:histidine kinase [Cellvibrio zantedeschiae]GGY70259.1 histidine kinase [Cellvibrio zantedeschiae]